MKRQSLISAFDDLLGPPVGDEIPEGFFSVEQIAKARNVTAKTLNGNLFDLAKSGKCERRKFRNENGRPCWFYRVK
jgi:predicted ArsR family transcriptional regulator